MFSRLRSPHFLLLLLLLLLSLSLALGACAAEVVSREPDTGSGSAEVLAIIDGEPITVADLDVEVADQLAKLEFEYGSERYQLLREGLGNLVRRQTERADRVGCRLDVRTGWSSITPGGTCDVVAPAPARLRQRSNRRVASEHRFLERPERVEATEVRVHAHNGDRRGHIVSVVRDSQGGRRIPRLCRGGPALW